MKFSFDARWAELRFLEIKVARKLQPFLFLCDEAERISCANITSPPKQLDWLVLTNDGKLGVRIKQWKPGVAAPSVLLELPLFGRVKYSSAGVKVEFS